MSTVFIALQANEETRSLIDAIVLDNPTAQVRREPAMIRVEVPNRLVINRSTIEEQLGRNYDLQEINVNLITLSGNVDETEDALTLCWNA